MGLKENPKFITGHNTMLYDTLDFFFYIVGSPKQRMKTMGGNFGGAQNVVFMSGLKKEGLSKKGVRGKGATSIHGPLPNSRRNQS